MDKEKNSLQNAALEIQSLRGKCSLLCCAARLRFTVAVTHALQTDKDKRSEYQQQVTKCLKSIKRETEKGVLTACIYSTKHKYIEKNRVILLRHYTKCIFQIADRIVSANPTSLLCFH
ncbi:MAG: hypothetical protein U1F12_03240 [Pseudomonadales bacterium]